MKKENIGVNILNRRNNYIKTSKIFNYSISLVKKNRLPLANKYKLGIKFSILKNN